MLYSSMASVLLKRDIWRQTFTQEEHRVKTKVAILGLRREAWTPQRNQGPDTLGFWPSEQ